MIGLIGADVFLLQVNGCLSEHLSVVSEGIGFSERSVVSNVQCLVWSGQMFFFFWWWCLSEHLSVVSEGMGFSERSVVCLMFSAWSDQGQMFFFFWWMVSIRASISVFRREWASQKRSVVCQCSLIGLIVGRCFLLQVNGVYQSIYHLVRREWASQKRSVVCLCSVLGLIGADVFLLQLNGVLSEHLSVVSEGRCFS